MLHWAPSQPLAYVDLKRQPHDRLTQLGPFGAVLALLQAERQPPELFGTRLEGVVHAIEQLPDADQSLGQRWLWYAHCLLHHRRPLAEHTTWREVICQSTSRQDLRMEVETMGQTIAESLKIGRASCRERV